MTFVQGIGINFLIIWMTQEKGFHQLSGWLKSRQ